MKTVESPRTVTGWLGELQEPGVISRKGEPMAWRGVSAGPCPCRSCQEVTMGRSCIAACSRYSGPARVGRRPAPLRVPCTHSAAVPRVCPPSAVCVKTQWFAIGCSILSARTEARDHTLFPQVNSYHLPGTAVRLKMINKLIVLVRMTTCELIKLIRNTGMQGCIKLTLEKPGPRAHQTPQSTK